MKKLFLITFMATPFFLLSSDSEESKLAIVRGSSPQRSATDRFIGRDNPLDGGEGLVDQITNVKKGQRDHASNIARLAKSHAKETKKADGELDKVEKETKKAVAEEKQQHDEETAAVEKAEARHELCQICQNSFCGRLGKCCCPSCFLFPCCLKPEILKELDEEAAREDQQKRGGYAEEMTRDEE